MARSSFPGISDRGKKQECSTCAHPLSLALRNMQSSTILDAAVSPTDQHIYSRRRGLLQKIGVKNLHLINQRPSQASSQAHGLLNLPFISTFFLDSRASSFGNDEELSGGLALSGIDVAETMTTMRLVASDPQSGYSVKITLDREGFIFTSDLTEVLTDQKLTEVEQPVSAENQGFINKARSVLLSKQERKNKSSRMSKDRRNRKNRKNVRLYTEISVRPRSPMIERWKISRRKFTLILREKSLDRKTTKSDDWHGLSWSLEASTEAATTPLGVTWWWQRSRKPRVIASESCCPLAYVTTVVS
jgi:hypothetical protein